MAKSLFQPLNIRVPIVDPKTGAPTAQFQRLMQELGLAAGLTVNGNGQISIADNGVTNAKLADMAAKTIKARKEATAGDPQDCTISEILDFLTGAAHGSILYRDAADWQLLAPGTAGQFLKTNGAGADPAWAAAGGGGGGFGTVDMSAYTVTGGPLSAPTEVTDTEFGYGLSHASANVTTNNFWFRTRAFSGNLTLITRILINRQSNGNNSLGIIFRQSGATTFVGSFVTWNTGIFIETIKSTNDGATQTGIGTSVTLSTGSVIYPAYLRAVYTSGTNTLTTSVSLNGVDWTQLYTGTTDVTPNQVGVVHRIQSSTGPLPGAGVYKYWSDSGNGVKWNLP